MDKIKAIQRRDQVRFNSLFSAVDRFFDDCDNFDRLFKLLQKTPKKRNPKKAKTPRKSLKLLDYAVSVYSLNGALVLINGRPLCINSIYKAGIHAHGRQYYDAFRRNHSFIFKKHGKQIKTTIAQLVFFRDLIRYKILDWIEENIEDINKQMTTNSKKNIEDFTPQCTMVDTIGYVQMGF